MEALATAAGVDLAAAGPERVAALWIEAAEPFPASGDDTRLHSPHQPQEST
jgi:hypothetical protein